MVMKKLVARRPQVVRTVAYSPPTQEEFGRWSWAAEGCPGGWVVALSNSTPSGADKSVAGPFRSREVALATARRLNAELRANDPPGPVKLPCPFYCVLHLQNMERGGCKK